MSHLKCGAQKWTEHVKCHIISMVHNGIVASYNLEAMLLLKKAKDCMCLLAVASH